MVRYVSVTVLVSLLSGCALFPKNKGVEEGIVWCNTRYLDSVKEHWPPYTGTASNLLEIADRGYPYALAGAALLQEPEDPAGAPKPGVMPAYFLSPSPVIERIPGLDEGDAGSGFRAATFRTIGGDPPELIIAFKGTNDARDWWLHNLSPFPEQFSKARAYVKRVHDSEYPRTRIVVTGYSLGGGLAAHVTQRPETSDMIQEAWVFNPSPRDGVWTHPDKRIWFASAKGEILNWFRFDYVGAPANQRSEGFDLIRSSNIYGHYRWVLARQMLHYADLKEHIGSGRTSTDSAPLQVLAASSDSKCSDEAQLTIKSMHKEYQEEMQRRRDKAASQ